MRTFTPGGVAGADITQAFPASSNCFEARIRKGLAYDRRKVASQVSIEETDKALPVRLNRRRRRGAQTATRSPRRTAALHSESGPKIEPAPQLNDGLAHLPHELLSIRGRPIETELITSCASDREVYKSHGVDTQRHPIELIVRQMMIEGAGRPEGRQSRAASLRAFVVPFDYGRFNQAVLRPSAARRPRPRKSILGYHSQASLNPIVPVARPARRPRRS